MSDPVCYSGAIDTAELREFAPVVHQLIGCAFETIQPLFLSGAHVFTKDDSTPVTQADRSAEERMRRLIETRYPAHGVLGEEFGERVAQTAYPRYRWVLDPIDGTRAFISNCFLFGTLIALERDDGEGFAPLLGAIGFPAAGRALVGQRYATRLYAADGSQRAVRVRTCSRIEDATILATAHWSNGKPRGGALVEGLTRRARLYRTWGDCFGYFAIATGGADVMLDPVLAYWDVAAIVPVIEGAGGRATSWTGGNPLASPSLIATAGPLHEAVLDALGVGR